MLREINFTDNDLDGISCGLLLKLHNPNMEVVYCNYKTINEKVLELLEDKKKLSQYEAIYITDISVNEKVAEKLEELYKTNKNMKIQLVDHHTSATWLNKYDWATVSTDIVTHTNLEGAVQHHITCGTELLSTILNMSKAYERYVELVRLYDTGAWVKDITVGECLELNYLLQIYGIEEYERKMYRRLHSGTEKYITNEDKEAIKLYNFQKNQYCEAKEKQMIIKEIAKYKFGVVFADRFKNDLATHLCNKFSEEIDAVAIIYNMETIEFRTNKDNVNLIPISKEFNGGGHSQAAGAVITMDAITKTIDKLFRALQ